MLIDQNIEKLGGAQTKQHLIEIIQIKAKQAVEWMFHLIHSSQYRDSLASHHIHSSQSMSLKQLYCI